MFVVHRLLISTILLTWIVGLELIKKTPMLWWAVLITSEISLIELFRLEDSRGPTLSPLFTPQH